VAGETRTVEQVLRDGGFTGFHRRVVAITGFAWTFVAFEIILIGLVLPVVGADFGIFDLATFTATNPLQYGLVVSATLIGSFAGSLGLGRAADRIGRRPVFVVCVLWYSVFTALTALSFDTASLFTFRLLAGLGLGGMLVVDPSLLSEYLPPQDRGRFMVFLDFFWPAGFLLAIAFWWAFIVQLGGAWRLLFLVAAFPAFIAFLFRATVPESPYFLARKGRLEDASRVLETISGRPTDPSTIAQERVVARAPVADLFRDQLRRRTGVTIAVWIALNFSYYGLFLWLPVALAGFQIVDFSDPATLALFLVVSALAQFPGYATSMLLVDRWGRKKTLATFLVLGGISGFLLATATNFTTLILGLILVSFFNLGAWGAVYPYTSELFPTQYRATGFGVAEGVGKVTAILGPVVFGLLLVYGGGSTNPQAIILPLSLIAAVMVFGGAVAAGLGPETKGAAFH